MGMVVGREREGDYRIISLPKICQNLAETQVKGGNDGEISGRENR